MAIEFWEDSEHSPLEALLKSIRSLRTDERILEMKVDADDGLVEGDDAYTWIQVSNQKPGMIAWCMNDDDGEFELGTYDMNLGVLTARSANTLTVKTNIHGLNTNPSLRRGSSTRKALASVCLTPAITCTRKPQLESIRLAH
jgi:hypothetical protein